MWAGGFGGSGTTEKNRDIVMKLSQSSSIDFVPFADRDAGGRLSNLAWVAIGPTDVAVEYDRPLDVAAERERLTKEIAKNKKGLAPAKRQVGNEVFLTKPPAPGVEGWRK